MDNRDWNSEIYFARISAAGVKLGSDTRITNDASISSAPSLVWTGSEFGVAWYDDRDGDYEIYFTRISADGVKLGSDIRVTNDASTSSVPSLVWTGSEYGVAWYDGRDGDTEIYFTRISAAGAKLGSDVRITNAAGDSGDPGLVWIGSEYGVAWMDNRDGSREIYFARISAAGAKLGSDVRITNAAGDSWSHSLVWSGGEYGVAWEDNRDGNAEIYFARIDPCP
jgi:predicted RecA/RadA family phage recombinase